MHLYLQFMTLGPDNEYLINCVNNEDSESKLFNSVQFQYIQKKKPTREIMIGMCPMDIQDS